MKKALYSILFGLSLTACRGVALEQRLADLPPGKTTETGAFTGNFVIPVSEVRSGAPLYIQNGTTTLQFLQINPREPFCRLSSVVAHFDNEELAAMAKVNRIRMRTYRGQGTVVPLDRVFLSRENGSYRAGGSTVYSLKDVNPGLKHSIVQFEFEGSLDCYRPSSGAPATGVITVGNLFQIMGFEWIWVSPVQL
jgi:hypothetical protein